MDVQIDTYPDRLEVRVPFDDAIPVLLNGGERITDDQDPPQAWARWIFPVDTDPQEAAKTAAHSFKDSFPTAPTDTTTVKVKI